MSTLRRKWLGGYVRHGKKGPSFVIERWIGGTHFHVSTKKRTERAAMKELELFEQDPIGYAANSSVTERLFLTDELLDGYRDWMINSKKTTKDWAHTTNRLLIEWMEDLGQKDLRHISVQRDLLPALEKRQTSRRHRIEAIKGFYSYLRRVKDLLRHAEDATLDLPVPKPEPAQYRRQRAVKPEHVSAVMLFLDEVTRDVLIFLMGTGWHLSEVARFAKHGEIVHPGNGPLAVVMTRHKSGRLHPTALQHQEHLGAAERILARGAIPARWTLAVAMRDACDAAKVPQFRMGVMRHTVATQALAAGASPAEVSRFLGHASPVTTQKFYADHAVPAPSVPVLKN